MRRTRTQDENVNRDIRRFPGASLRFRDELREARYAAGRDAEGFQEVVFAIERLGRACCPTASDLGQCKQGLITLVNGSFFTAGQSCAQPIGQRAFDNLYELVREGRNDALHQGAIARNLTKHAVDLALILEDALMPTERVVRDFMVANPIRAEVWESISSIRRTMLVNAFSFLPFQDGGKWYLLSDYDLARYLSDGDRKKRLASFLSAAIEEEMIQASEAGRCHDDESVKTVLDRALGRPMLVFDRDREQLIGLLTTYDVL